MLVDNERIEKLCELFDDRESQHKVRNMLRLVRNEYEQEREKVHATLQMHKDGTITAEELAIHLEWI